MRVFKIRDVCKYWPSFEQLEALGLMQRINNKRGRGGDFKNNNTSDGNKARVGWQRCSDLTTCSLMLLLFLFLEGGNKSQIYNVTLRYVGGFIFYLKILRQFLTARTGNSVIYGQSSPILHPLATFLTDPAASRYHPQIF